MMSHPSDPRNTLHFHIHTEKLIGGEIKAKILVGNSAHAEDYLCIHKTLHFKKFGIFSMVKFEDIPTIESHVTFNVKERPNRVMLWAESLFCLDHEDNKNISQSSDMIQLGFKNVKDDQMLVIEASQESFGMRVRIFTDDINVSSELFNELMSYLKI